ncbi:MAG: DUF2087 domain-containing protein [Bacillota bacterium]
MEISESISIMKALGDSSRLLIINSLMEKPQYLEEIAERLNLAVSTVSFHMKKLESAGLVNKKKEQYYAVFHINENIFHSTLKDLVSFDNAEKAMQDKRMLEYRNKVIQTYFENGKLIRIPSQHKKRLIILDEIIKIFEKDRTYPEKEVDSLLEAINDDYCSIRRYFIDEGMMKREKGIYRVNPDYREAIGTEAVNFREKKAKPKKSITEINLSKEISMDAIKRKEIINNYKQTPTPMGVYQLKNLKNGKILVGSTYNLDARRNREMMMLKLKAYTIKEIQEAWDELGEDGVAFEVLDRLEPKKDDTENRNYRKDLETLEDLWCEKLQPYDEKGYNKRKL